MRGIVTTRGQFDRELTDMYTVPIYVTATTTTPYTMGKRTIDGGGGAPDNQKAQMDVATIVVHITDINDHAPEFRPGTCYRLAVPENNEPSIIHTVVATDLDEGNNGDIVYSISGEWFFFCFALFAENAKTLIRSY